MAKQAKRRALPKKAAGKKTLNLALQGGGAHGAFTWGVLDRLLQEKNLFIEAVTATSAGAINASIMAYGLITGDREHARALLREFWLKISQAAILSPLQPTWMDKWLGNNNVTFSPGFVAMDFLTRVFSPTQLNILDINPLRTILDGIVDFEAIRDNKTIQLFVNATNVRTGKIKIFNTDELTIDMLMASACLPFLYKTVYVDDEPYWDGGYCGNPALFPLFYKSACQDIAIVQINPVRIDEAPVSAAEILDRVNEISFNSNLMREVRAIAFVKRLLREGKIDNDHYKNVKLHLIEAEAIMNSLDSASKYNADWDFLQHLHHVGHQAADDWLAANYDKINKHSSMDIEEVYL